jgi:spermidine dehydrogenase
LSKKNPLKITRRDFLDGMALAGGAVALSPLQILAGSQEGAHAAQLYPPSLTGMRGNHPGSFEVAHALAREGQRPDEYELLDEAYDLVVVGAGISGLTAAYLFRKQFGPDAKILILDNHDDFGGHAKRNEFTSQGHTLLGVGGSLNLEQAAMGEAERSLLEEVGVDFSALRSAIEPGFLVHDPMSRHGIYLNSSEYAEDRSVVAAWNLLWAGVGDFESAIRSLKLSTTDEQGLIALVSGGNGFLDDIPLADREHFARQTEYALFLRERVGLSEQALKITEPWIKALHSTGAEGVSIYEALNSGAPGMNTVMPTPESESEDDTESVDPSVYQYPIFPDGNASVARLLVRQLIPAAVGGDLDQNVVTSRFDYSQLDREDAPVRLRLNSTAVKAINLDDDQVEVAYVSAGRTNAVRANYCILAGYGGMVPHLCPELPEAQKQHLSYGVKAPFICTNVLLRNAAGVRNADVSSYQCPGSFYSLLTSAPPVNLGDFRVPLQADDPMVIWMLHSPTPAIPGGLSARDAYRLGRHKLLSMSFEEIESVTLSQLAGMFGSTGFDADRDVEAITVNRWAHGYAYEYMDLHDPEWPEGQAPHELGRKPIGRIAIANSDTEAYAYVQAAMKAARRAVSEVLSK